MWQQSRRSNFKFQKTLPTNTQQEQKCVDMLIGFFEDPIGSRTGGQVLRQRRNDLSLARLSIWPNRAVVVRARTRPRLTPAKPPSGQAWQPLTNKAPPFCCFQMTMRQVVRKEEWPAFIGRALGAKRSSARALGDSKTSYFSLPSPSLARSDVPRVRIEAKIMRTSASCIG